MWEGGECWIIGGGPSLPHQFGVPRDIIKKVLSQQASPAEYSPFLSPIHDKHVIGVNAAYLLGSWVDLIFIGDNAFYSKNRAALAERTKLTICCNPNSQRYAEKKELKMMGRDSNCGYGISTKPGKVSWNKNSGAASISLAVQLGVKRIYLLGFDMALGIEKTQHWHSHYSTAGDRSQAGRKLPFNRHLKAFPAVARDAKILGVEIINVNPNSEITHFKKVALKDIL